MSTNANNIWSERMIEDIASDASAAFECSANNAEHIERIDTAINDLFSASTNQAAAINHNADELSKHVASINNMADLINKLIDASNRHSEAILKLTEALTASRQPPSPLGDVFKECKAAEVKPAKPRKAKLHVVKDNQATKGE